MATGARATWPSCPNWARSTVLKVGGIHLAAGGEAAISSTRIRTLVAEGDVAGAVALLGRPHQVRGPVVHGDGRGRAELGLPHGQRGGPR